MIILKIDKSEKEKIINSYTTDIEKLEMYFLRSGDRKNSEIEKRTGIDRNTISSIRKGKTRPSSANMTIFVSAYNIPSNVAGDIFFKQNLRNR